MEGNKPSEFCTRLMFHISRLQEEPTFEELRTRKIHRTKQFDLMHLNAAQWGYQYLLAICLDVRSGRWEDGLRRSWIQTNNRWWLIISTTVQDNAPFVTQTSVVWSKGLLSKNTVLSCRKHGHDFVTFKFFSVRMRIRVCAWFTTSFKKRHTFPKIPGSFYVVVFTDPVLG